MRARRTPPADVVGDERLLALPRGPAREAAARRKLDAQFIVLPLVVYRGPIFGVLHVEDSTVFDERDIVFVNAVANQLAIAIDRQRPVATRQATTEAREREQRLLAEIRATLGSALDYGACRGYDRRPGSRGPMRLKFQARKQQT